MLGKCSGEMCEGVWLALLKIKGSSGQVAAFRVRSLIHLAPCCLRLVVALQGLKWDRGPFPTQLEMLGNGYSKSCVFLRSFPTLCFYPQVRGVDSCQKRLEEHLCWKRTVVKPQSLFFCTKANVEKDKSFSLHEDQKATNCGSLGKPVHKENQKGSVDENRRPLGAEPAQLVSEKRKLLKRKRCSEDPPGTDVASKIVRRGEMPLFVWGASWVSLLESD